MKSSLENIIDLWGHFSLKNKILFCVTTFSSIISAIFETQVLVTFIPLISKLTSIDSSSNADISLRYNFIFRNLYSENTSTSKVLFIFSFLVVTSALIRLLFLYLASINAASIGSQLSKLCFKSIIYRPYINLIAEDTGEIIEMILGNIARTIKVIMSCSVIISSSLLTLAIIFSLLLVDVKITLIIFSVLVSSYLILYRLAKLKLYNNGKVVFSSSTSIISLGKESIYSIKEIIIKNLYSKYINKFEKIDVKLRRKQASSQFIALYPRYILEAISILLLTNIAYSMGKNEVNLSILPKLGFFSLGFIRLLPAIQQIYSRLSNIRTFLSSIEALNSVLVSKKEFKKIEIENTEIKFPPINKNIEKIIRAENISFKYPKGQNEAITNLSLTFEKGKHYAIVGKSGCGKSTLIDLLLGILTPTKGNIYFYDINIKQPQFRNFYYTKIAYVPQTPIILNESIKNNIILDSDSFFDEEYLYKVIKSVNLENFVQKNGINFFCGEDGINLSGGQRQRIAIARALYANKAILFIDECCSALDSATENDVMNAIFTNFKNKTIISVTHNINQIEKYDEIIRLEE